MRNILTYEFLSRLHKDTIWNKRLFFFNFSGTDNTGKDKISSMLNTTSVCAKRTYCVRVDKWQQSEARESEGTRHSQTAATNPHIHNEDIAHTHTLHSPHKTCYLSRPPHSLQTAQQSLFVLCAIRFIRLTKKYISIKSYSGATDTAGDYGVMHCVLEKGLLFVKNLLVCGKAGTSPFPSDERILEALGRHHTPKHQLLRSAGP